MEKKNTIFCVLWFFIGVILAGVFGYIRESKQAARFNTERTGLEREYAERQRKLESSLEYAERTVAGAREITERTGEKLQRSAGNLREASAIIGDVYIQVKALENWFSDRNTSSSGGGVADRMYVE